MSNISPQPKPDDAILGDRASTPFWNLYSKGHFGFSVQAKILKLYGFRSFIDRIGWKIHSEIGGRGAWDRVEQIRRKDNIPCNLDAPQGYLPFIFSLGGGRSRSQPYTNDTESVMGFYSIDGYYNEWSSDSFFGAEMVASFLARFYSLKTK